MNVEYNFDYIAEQAEMILAHISHGQPDPLWVANHCEILCHFAQNVHDQSLRVHQNQNRNQVNNARKQLKP